MPAPGRSGRRHRVVLGCYRHALVSFDALANEIVLVDKVAPAAVIAASRRSSEGWIDAMGSAGRLSYAEGAPPASPSTYFDLASVTKPVTALLAARLVRRGLFTWDTPLADLLEEARGTPSERIPVELLFAHRAGLEAHRPLYAPLLHGGVVDKRAALVEAASARRPECVGAPREVGFPPVYSDLGYLLAGEALARVGKDSLDALMTREVCKPLGSGLGSARRLRASDASFDNHVAATEVVAFRGGTVVGQVHDENAWAIGGEGVCGHAGLFGTARDLVLLGRAILDAMHGRRDDWLTASEIDVLVRPREGGSLRAGFDGKSGEESSAGKLFGPRTVGHLGFTGTSLWIDPDQELVGVLLTNRVHVSRDGPVIRAVRPKVYEAIGRWGQENE